MKRVIRFTVTDEYEIEIDTTAISPTVDIDDPHAALKDWESQDHDVLGCPVGTVAKFEDVRYIEE